MQWNIKVPVWRYYSQPRRSQFQDHDKVKYTRVQYVDPQLSFKADTLYIHRALFSCGRQFEPACFQFPRRIGRDRGRLRLINVKLIGKHAGVPVYEGTSAWWFPGERKSPVAGARWNRGRVSRNSLPDGEFPSTLWPRWIIKRIPFKRLRIVSTRPARDLSRFLHSVP